VRGFIYDWIPARERTDGATKRKGGAGFPERRESFRAPQRTSIFRGPLDTVTACSPRIGEVKHGNLRDDERQGAVLGRCGERKGAGSRRIRSSAWHHGTDCTRNFKNPARQDSWNPSCFHQSGTWLETTEMFISGCKDGVRLVAFAHNGG